MKNPFTIYSVNLYSRDCEKSARLYSKIFGLTIIALTPKHSEVVSGDGFRIVFSEKSEKCPVDPGTVTFLSDKIEKEYLSSFFRLESENSDYISFLDEYGNRIWNMRKRVKE